MKKVEFPTFLNEQPAIIFGLTTRQILVLICGVLAGYSVWSATTPLLNQVAWHIGCTVLGCSLFLLSLVVAKVSIGAKHLEEWVCIWFLYALMPKIALYRPLSASLEMPGPDRKKRYRKGHRDKKKREIILDDLEED
jgi:hypothetical protein